MRDLFYQAANAAPCIIFIDELDALARARGLGTMGGHDEKEQTLNQLLSELDGFDPQQGIVLLAATNRPEILDAALLRAGRFDRQVLVDRPDKVGRLAIVQIHLKRVRLGADVKPEQVAELTPGFSGADLANLVNEAALLATRRSFLGEGIPDMGPKDYSEETAREIDCAVRELTNRARECALSILKANRSALDSGAQRLLETETMLARDIQEVVRPVGDEAKPDVPGASHVS